MGVIATEVQKYSRHSMHPIGANEASDRPVATLTRDNGVVQRFRLQQFDSPEVYEKALKQLAVAWVHRYRRAPNRVIYEVIAVGAEETEDDHYLICRCFGQSSDDVNLACFLVKEFERFESVQM